MNKERKTLCKEEFTICEIVQENKKLKVDFEKLREQYIELAQDNDKLEEKIHNITNEIKNFIEIIEQQPSEDDSYLLKKLNSFLYVLESENK